MKSIHILQKKLKKTKTINKIVIIIGILLAAYLILQFLYTGYYIAQGKKLSTDSFPRKTTLGDEKKPHLKLFITGDSVGEGVGASRFEKSVSGRLADHLAKSHYITFENQSVTGTKMGDLLSMKMPDGKQDIIILIVSSNDLFRFISVGTFKKQTDAVLAKYGAHTDKLILVGPGRVFDGEAVPFFLRIIYKQKAPAYIQVMELFAKENPKIIYVNPTAPDFYEDSYGPTTAEDKFHPNDEGHRLWFDLIKTAL